MSSKSHSSDPLRADTLAELPARLRVVKLLESRYQSGSRPLSWDERRAGVDVILTEDGKTIRLASDGQQSPPQPGWTILVSDGNTEGYTWTLYGIAAGSTELPKLTLS